MGVCVGEAVSREIEAKLAIADRAAFERVRALREVAGYEIAEGEEVQVHDRYWDTPERALMHAGWALRYRESGVRVILTLKSLKASPGPVHEREEREAELKRLSQPQEWPESELKRIVMSAIGDAELVSLFVVDQRRFIRSMTRGERIAAHMSLDRITVLAGGRKREYRELEIELQPCGTREDLSLVLAALQKEVALVPSPRSKFEEGLLLLEGGGGRPVRHRAASSSSREIPAEVLVLEAPVGTTEEKVCAELRRLGYRLRERSQGEEIRLYFDTQGGSLARKGRELYFESRDSRWHLTRRGRRELSEKGKGEAPPDTGSLGRTLRGVAPSSPRVPYLEAALRNTRLSLSGISLRAVNLSIRTWRLHSPLHNGSEASALTLEVDRGRASRVPLDYLVGLLSKGLGLHQMEGTFRDLAQTRLDVPFPGAPLPRRFVPSAGDEVSAVCRKILGGESWRMKANTPGAIRDLDPEFVHDVRVATRRARFACRLFATALGEEESAKIRAELSWIAGLLGGVRDIDVLRARLASQLALIDADPLFAETIGGLLDGRRSQAREALVQAFGSPRYASLIELMTSAAVRPATGMPGGTAPSDVFARRSIGKALRRIAPWTARDPGGLSPVELHRIRILFKRLRYTMEFFRPLLGESVTALLKECIGYQDCLGLYQDAQVALRTLGGLAAERTLRESSGGLLALGELIQVQRHLIGTQQERFGTLWRSSLRLSELWGSARFPKPKTR
jgi:inorganic triphosphatase YgiF